MFWEFWADIFLIFLNSVFWAIIFLNTVCPLRVLGKNYGGVKWCGLGVVGTNFSKLFFKMVCFGSFRQLFFLKHCILWEFRAKMMGGG